MEKFCPYCIIEAYHNYCMCKVINEPCFFVRRCSIESRWKPVSNMEVCKLRMKQESKYMYKIRFEKRGKLYVEYGDFVVKVDNPFGDKIPEGVNDLVEVNGVVYIKGYEPKPIKEEKETKKEVKKDINKK